MKPVTTVTIEMVGYNPILNNKHELIDAVCCAIESYEEDENLKTFGNVSFRVDAKIEDEEEE